MKEHVQVIQVAVARPWVTLEEYGVMVGVSAETVRGWCANGLIKWIKRGKRILVNNMAESIEAAGQCDEVKIIVSGGE